MLQTLAVQTVPAVKVNPFANVFHLTHVVKIIIPSTVNVNQSIDTSAYVDEVAALLSDLNGGATITDGNGCWLSPVEGLVKEPVKIVSSACEELTEKLLVKLYEYAVKVKVELSQEAVAVEIDGALYFI